MIESLIISIGVLTMVIIEFKTSKIHIIQFGYEQLVATKSGAPTNETTMGDLSLFGSDHKGDYLSTKMMTTGGDDVDLDKQLRHDALKSIIAAIQGNFVKKFEDEALKRMMSMPAEDADKEELDDRAKSYPLSPKALKEMTYPKIADPDNGKQPNF
jgi:hypothetical protein